VVQRRPRGSTIELVVQVGLLTVLLGLLVAGLVIAHSDALLPPFFYEHAPFPTGWREP
jgi:hypothetical protein